MPFIFDKSSNENIQQLCYNDSNLNFYFISNRNRYTENFILYKSKFNNINYSIENRIIQLINNHNLMTSYRTLYNSDTKFIDFDQIFEKILYKKNENNYDLDISTDMEFYYTQNIKLLTNIYNSDIILNIESEILKNKYQLDNIIEEITFEEGIKKIVSIVIEKLSSIIDDINDIDFKKINSYLDFICVANYNFHSKTEKLKLNYKNFQISQTEINKFNKLNIDFEELKTFHTNHHNEYNKFFEIIANSPSNLSLRYDTFSFKESPDAYGRRNISLHVPLLSEYITYDKLDLTSKYSNNSFYCVKNDIIFLSLTKLYFYIFKKSGKYLKLKDEFEKLVLK